MPINYSLAANLTPRRTHPVPYLTINRSSSDFGELGALNVPVQPRF